MADQEQKPGEFALVKAVRSLDQGGREAIPDKLDQIWKILSIYRGGKFHAAEEMVLRWLLKNMNGSSDDAEKLRRYPLTWRILGKVFSSMPLFSLAKALADRRFVAVLQSALKDISAVQAWDDYNASQPSDIRMSDADTTEDATRPSKRTRLDPVVFDNESQRLMPGCLRTAETLFETIRLLLARVESRNTTDVKRESILGAEHIKSLFCSSATEITDLILPALNFCSSTLKNKTPEGYVGQHLWISTICTLWDLHLRSDGDAMQFATHLSRPAMTMFSNCSAMSRTIQHGEAECGVGDDVRHRWEDDLRHFLTSNLILPARTAFLNQGNLEIIRVMVEKTIDFSTLSCPAIFDLVINAPHLATGQSAKRSNDTWIQAAFTLLEETIRNSRSPKQVRAITDIICEAITPNDGKNEKCTSLSPEILRSVCRTYALHSNPPDWDLLFAVADLSIDPFVTGDSEEFLQAVLDKSTEYGQNEGHGSVQDLIVRVAKAFTEARDLAGFVKKWYRCLIWTEPHISPLDSGRIEEVWYNQKLCSIVSDNLERTMNVKQILSLLDWLRTQGQGPAENAALILIAGTLSEGIKQDDVVDAIGTQIFDMVMERRLPNFPSSQVLDAKWQTAKNSLGWATLEQGQAIWTTSTPHLQGLKNCEVNYFRLAELFSAFTVAAAAWVANHPGGRYEDEAADLTWGYLSRMNKSPNFKDLLWEMVADYLTTRCPRLLSMLAERRDIHCLNLLVPDWLTHSAKTQHMKDIIANENNINSGHTIDTILTALVKVLDHHNESSKLYAIEALLNVPLEAISRERRETIMCLLVSGIESLVELDNRSRPNFLKLMISLMLRLMTKPTFYKDIAFHDIDKLASIAGGYDRENCLLYLPLLEELANLTIRQMTSNMEEREKHYICEAVSLAQSFTISPKDLQGRLEELLAIRITLAKVLVLGVRQRPVLDAIPDLGIERLERHLIDMITCSVEFFCSDWQSRRDHTPSLRKHLVSLSVAFEATEALTQNIMSETLSAFLPQLKEASEILGQRDDLDVWGMRRFLLKCSSKDATSPLRLSSMLESTKQYGEGAQAKCFLVNKDGMLEYVDAVIQGADEDTKLDYIKILLEEEETRPPRAVRLLVVERILHHLEGSRAVVSAPNKFDLATVHTVLCQKLRESATGEEFALTSRILRTLLDDKWTAMTQWNIELTLGTVSVLASQTQTHAVVSKMTEAYSCISRLVQVVVRRHRLRIEGHFHILITVLQSLLRSLIDHFHTCTSNIWSPGPTEHFNIQDFRISKKHAKAYARLLTMVCEPTAGSVSRSSTQPGSLDSATDAAKRYAGQHMYLVLMSYIKLQLEGNVPHHISEAIKPGVFAILDITTPQQRRIMNDALDVSGRAILKELYNQYLKFGKWSGI